MFTNETENNNNNGTGNNNNNNNNNNNKSSSGGGDGGDGGGGGGIAWAGSLVGSKNPNNLGYRYSTPSKRYRCASQKNGEEDITGGTRELPANVQIRFRNRRGDEIQETLDLPVGSSVDDLTSLLHSLMMEESREDGDSNSNGGIPYSFYIKVPRDENEKNDATGAADDVEITDDCNLADVLRKYTTVSTEQVIPLTYQPLSVFRVRPVTRCTDTLPGHTEAVLHVSYAPDGKLLASGGGDCAVRFWDVQTSTTKFRCCDGHKNHVLCTAWSPDGRRFASADKDGVLFLWDVVAGGKPAGRPVKAHSKWITALAWEPLHMAGKDGGNGGNHEESNGEDGSSSSFCCDRLATSSRDGTVRVWNARTRCRVATLSGHADSVECVKWGGEGLVYTGSRDRTIKVWNPDRGILVRTLTGHGHRINTLALSSDYCLRAGPFDYRHRNFDSPTAAHRSAADKYRNFVESSGTERLVSGSDDYTLCLWEPTSSNKRPVKRLTGHQQAVNHIAFSPDGRFFASASFDKKVKVWNGLSGEFLVTLTGHVGAVYQVAWSADSRYLVTASKDSTAKLWQMPAGKRAKETLPGHADEVYALDWCPCSGSVATGSKDRTIKIWKH